MSTLDLGPLGTVTFHRQQWISSLASCAESLLLDPALAKTGSAERVAYALRDEISAYEKLVVSLHRSSSEPYALRDLPTEEKNDYERAKHAVGLLVQIHGPQAAQ